MLKVDNINTYYGNIQALKGVSLEVEEGEIVTLIGANGAGKTTTLMSLCGIVPPRSGEILFQGKPVHGLSGDKIVQMGIIQVPEGRRIFPNMSVMENLEMGAYLRTNKMLVSRTFTWSWSFSRSLPNAEARWEELSLVVNSRCWQSLVP
jgi:branched-chain amino acid transport system ATP-binding protein